MAAFHLVWIAWPCLLYPRLTAALGAATLTYAVVQLSLRVLVWVVPVFAYLRFVDGVDPVEYLKLRHHVARGVLVAAAVTALNFAGTWARFGPPHLSAARVTWNSVLGTSFLVGFIVRLALETTQVTPELRAFLVVGFCGGFTTFSTFAWETLALAEQGSWGRSLLYLGLSVVLALAGCVAGMSAARQAVSALHR